MTRENLLSKTRDELDRLAVAMGADPTKASTKADVVDLILVLTADVAASTNGSEPDTKPATSRHSKQRRNATSGGPDSNQEKLPVTGILEMREGGFGFLHINGYLGSKNDIYVSNKYINKFHLRSGDVIDGDYVIHRQTGKNNPLVFVRSINGEDPKKSASRPKFEELTPLFPDMRLTLEREREHQNMTTRIIDLLAPIGKGQRGMIVSPPKAGKTTIMKEIVRSIELNNPEAKLFILLVDERPEEVTDMKRWVTLDASEVIASTFDKPAIEHIRIAEVVLDRAKRLVEMGQDIVIVLDGITRLARAYNQALPGTGRLMSGGMDASALFRRKNSSEPQEI